MPAIVNQSLNQRYLSVADADERKKFIYSKLYPIKELVENKSLIIVDEAIFTGLTLKVLCGMLRELNTKKIYLCLPTPMCIQKCLYDVMPQKNILLENIRVDMLKDYFDADEVIFQEFNYFKSVINEYFPNTCMDCFNLKNAV